MPCYHPLHGYKARRVSSSGKRAVVFNPKVGYKDLPASVPCGQCVGCRLERSRQWAMRIMHEASLSDDNVFVTLTYDDSHLPPFGSLEPRDFQLFMKRLRKSVEHRVRYFHCGEYGERTSRPHYHAIIFNHNFVDKSYFTSRGGHPVYTSETLNALWKKGFCEIGSVTFESAAYVARYILKKVTGSELARRERYEVVDPESGEIRMRHPEYATMSRNKGIGADWFEKYKDEVYPSDSVYVRGAVSKPPRYYDTLIEPEMLEIIQAARRAKRDRKDETEARLEVREAVVKSRLETFTERPL